MKTCPQCGRPFDGDYDYCLDDGSLLVPAASGAAPSAPTIVLRPVGPLAETRRAPAGKTIHLIVGAMGLVILSLSVVIVALTFRKTSPSEQNASEIKTGATNTDRTSSAPNATGPVTPGSRPLDEDSVRSLLLRWKKAQDERNFAVYKSLYAPQFEGIKRTKSGRQSRMDYAGWMNDRQKMFRNLIDVSADDPQIAIDGDSATIVFIQRFRSVNYEDTGQKTLKLKTFPEGPRIVFEELKYAY